MDYFTRYGLEFNPFIKNSKEILVDTSEYRETMFRLDYLAKTKGFGILTGAPGRGKTTAIRSWASLLNFKKPNNFRIIQEEITRLSIEKRKTPVIIIDEANYINNAILNDLKYYVLFTLPNNLLTLVFDLTIQKASSLYLLFR